MENKDVALKINEQELKSAKLKSKTQANIKILYALISTIVTIFATIYSGKEQLVILSILLFVVPSYIESLNVITNNFVVTLVVKIYKVIFKLLNIILLTIFVWYLFNKADAYTYTKNFQLYIIYSDIILNIVYNLFSYVNLRYNTREHIALAVVENASNSKQKDKLEFKENRKDSSKQINREFVKNKSKRKKGEG